MLRARRSWVKGRDIRHAADWKHLNSGGAGTFVCHIGGTYATEANKDWEGKPALANGERAAVLEQLATGISISQAARQAGVSRATIMRAAKADTRNSA